MILSINGRVRWNWESGPNLWKFNSNYLVNDSDYCTYILTTEYVNSLEEFKEVHTSVSYGIYLNAK